MPNPTTEETKVLLQHCLAGDAAAWETFVKTCRPLLAGAIQKTLRRYGTLPQPSGVDDLIQETLASLIQGDRAALRRFQWDCSLEGYLTLVAVSRTIDHLRRSREDRPGPAEAWKTRIGRDLGDERVPGTSSLLEGQETERAVHQALERLPFREHLALKLFYWDGFPLKRIAGILRVPAGTAGYLLHQGRKRLAELLKNSLLCLFL